jgi:hypothetical protein
MVCKISGLSFSKSKGFGVDLLSLFELEDPNVDDRLDFVLGFGGVKTVEGP